MPAGQIPMLHSWCQSGGQTAKAPLPLSQAGGPRCPSGQQMATTWIFISFRLWKLAENCIFGLSDISEWVGTWHSQKNWQVLRLRQDENSLLQTEGPKEHNVLKATHSLPGRKAMQLSVECNYFVPQPLPLACLSTCYFPRTDFWPQTPIPNGQNLCLFFGWCSWT